MKKVFSVSELDPRAVYPLLTATVIPRPIAWVSSLAADGTPNLAPHSFFTVASQRPPIVQFTSVGEKDSVRNIRATEEFVIALVSDDLAEQANICGTSFPAEIDEFAEANVETHPSTLVAPASVAPSPVNLECRLHRIVEVGDCFLVLGEVLAWSLDEEILDDAASPGRVRPLADRIRPLSRLGGDQWAKLGELFELARPRYR